MKKCLLAVISLLIFMCAGCSKEEISSAEAEKIIEDFNTQDYSYTLKFQYYNGGTDGSVEIADERKGMKTEDPYRQYEITTLEPPSGEYEKYWIENGDLYNCYTNFYFSDGVTDWYPASGEAKKEARGTALYDRDGLEYKFERDEDQYSVFSADYEIDGTYSANSLGLSDDPNETITRKTSAKAEYYINKETKKVDKILILLLGSGRMMKIQELVAEGMDYEKAAEKVDEMEMDQYGYPVYEYQIEYTDDIVINIPDDFSTN